MIVGRDAASGKRAKRVHACLHSLRESVFTMLRVIDASIIAMSVADDSRDATIRWDGDVKRRRRGGRRRSSDLYYKGKYDVISHLKAPLMAHEWPH